MPLKVSEVLKILEADGCTERSILKQAGIDRRLLRSPTPSSSNAPTTAVTVPGVPTSRDASHWPTVRPRSSPRCATPSTSTSTACARTDFCNVARPGPQRPAVRGIGERGARAMQAIAEDDEYGPIHLVRLVCAAEVAARTFGSPGLLAGETHGAQIGQFITGSVSPERTTISGSYSPTNGVRIRAGQALVRQNLRHILPRHVRDSRCHKHRDQPSCWAFRLVRCSWVGSSSG
jgi:hypothetical protein